MKKMPPYAKAVIGGLNGFFLMFTKSLGDGKITGVEISQIVGSTVIAAATVYLIPNGKKASEIDS